MGFPHEPGTDQTNPYIFQEFIPFVVGTAAKVLESMGALSRLLTWKECRKLRMSKIEVICKK